MNKRRGNQKHSLEAIQNALQMIQRGENPFRVSKRLGIARTTLLYHMERMPDHVFPTGVNPVIDHIRHQIELLLWKTRLRLIKNIFHKSRKSDEKTSALVWKSINESPIPAVGSLKSIRPALAGISADDKVTFREFVFERKKSIGGKDKLPSEGLAEASLDNGNGEETLEVDGDLMPDPAA